MAGIIAIGINKERVVASIKLEGLNSRELSMVHAQLGIMQRDILNKIDRLTRR